MRIAAEAAYIAVSCERSTGKFQHEQRSHQIGYNLAWEYKRKPEERTSEHIKTVRAYEIGAQVGVPVPIDISGPYSVMGKAVKRNLLYIKIPIIQKKSAVKDHIYSEKHT